MTELSADRRQQLPWAVEGSWRPGPPLKGLKTPEGGRLCELCGASYLGERACEGGQSCPRWYGLRRRQLIWSGGFWVLHGLLQKWETEDAAAADAQRAWAPPGSADFAVAYKAPPTEAQFAAHRQLQQARSQQQQPQKAAPAPKPPPQVHLGTPCSQWSTAGTAAAGHGYLAKPPPPKAPRGASGTPTGAASSAGSTVVVAAGHSSGDACNMRKLHIKNLRPAVTEDDMRGIFKFFGSFETFEMGSQQCWITFQNHSDAQDAMSSMQGFQLVGQELVIEVQGGGGGAAFLAG